LKTIQLILAAAFIGTLAGCGGVSGPFAQDAGPSVSNGCIAGTHLAPNGHCVVNANAPDCSSLADTNGNGIPDALESECADGGAGADGGTAGNDGGTTSDAGQPAVCSQTCFLVSPAYFVSTDAGRVYTFSNGTPVPTGPGVTLLEVGLPTPRGLKVCYGALLDYDNDGIANCIDNCWMTANPRPGCSSDQGCVNAGGTCSTDGFCIAQLDSDHDTVGDQCDPRPGYDDSALRVAFDPDPDNDGIPVPEDRCPATMTSLVGNATDSDADGIPDACDPCAYPNMSCQHP
jgi:hypothetical protein